jgi:hypothetical protein
MGRSRQLLYLFQLVHQGRRVLEGFVVAIVQALRENLIDDPVFACRYQLLWSLKRVLHTPVGHHRLDLLKLRSSHDESHEVCCLELVWNMGCHDR